MSTNEKTTTQKLFNEKTIPFIVLGSGLLFFIVGLSANEKNFGMFTFLAVVGFFAIIGCIIYIIVERKTIFSFKKKKAATPQSHNSNKATSSSQTYTQSETYDEQQQRFAREREKQEQERVDRHIRDNKDKFKPFLNMLVQKGIKPGKPFPPYSDNVLDAKTLTEKLTHLSTDIMEHLGLSRLNIKFDSIRSDTRGGHQCVAFIQGKDITVYLNEKYTLSKYTAMIAHECVHYFMGLYGLNVPLHETSEQLTELNELQTEVATIYLGFGMAYETAYQEIKKRSVSYEKDGMRETISTEKLGYISLDDIKTIRKMIDELPKPKPTHRQCPNCKLETPYESVFCKHCGYEHKMEI